MMTMMTAALDIVALTRVGALSPSESIFSKQVPEGTTMRPNL